ncbi:MAG: fimbrillin family protein [Rikenellaceae bacterium]
MKKLLYIGIAAAILGCTKSEELSTSAADGAISFSAGEIATRVTDGGTTLSWESNEKINVTDGTTSATYTISNTSTGALQYYSGNAFYTYGNSEQTFYGWSPSTLTATEGKLSLDLSDQTSVSQVVVGTASTTTTTATFAFAPIYTKVVFNLTAGGADVTALTDAKATLSGANVTGKYDYAAGTFDATSLVSATITPEVVGVDGDSSKATITVYILETTSMSGELTISVNGIDFVSSLAGKSWAEGDMYEYNVTVGATND